MATSWNITAFRFTAAGLLLAATVSAQRPWWADEPLRIIDLTTSLDQIDSTDPAASAARKASLGFNAEHLEIMRMPAGLDDQGFYFHSKVAGRTNLDYLRTYLPEAKKRGIRVFIYFNVHWYTVRFAEAHPEWRQVRENGKPLDGVYNTGANFCVNSPWREWCFQVLRDLAAYPIDGIFYDGPIFHPDTCYCRYCRDKFRRTRGGDLPSKRERRGARFKELVDFQAASLADFLHDSRQVLKSLNPQIAFYMNGGVRGGNWATGRLNRVLVPEQDLLGSEGGFIYGDLTRMPMWKPGLTARLLETQSAGKPRVIFSAAAHKPWTFAILPAPELRLLYADSIANGASVWFGVTPFEIAQPEMEALRDMNAYLARAGEYYKDTRSQARVAVVWSDATANFYPGTGAQLIDAYKLPSAEVGNLDAEFSGLTDGLLRAHVPFDVVDDTTLEREPLDRWSLLVLPNVACMSDGAASRIREFVRRGGKVIATFETSAYDETGIRRSNLALADLFGVRDTAKVMGPRRFDFMKPSGKDAALDGITREFIPSPAWYLKVESHGGTALLRYTKALKGPYDGVPELSDDPALTTHPFGKGSAMLFTGELGATIQNFHTPELLRVIANIGQPFRPVELENAPGSVEVVVRAQGDGRTLVHLVNFTGDMTRPIRSIVPLSNLKIRIHTPATRAYTLVRQQELPIKNGEIILPRIDEYEVVVFGQTQ